MTRNRARDQRRNRGSAAAARVLVVVGALAGLFAMHGLADHAASAHAMPPVPASVVGVTMAHTDHAAHDGLTAAGDLGAVLARPADPAPDRAMAGLCVAVLAGTVVGLVFVRLRASRSIVRPHSAWSTSAPFASLRERDPPCLFELSVLRT